MSRSGKRSANYTRAEIDVLLSNLEDNVDLIQNKIGERIKNIYEFNQHWDEIAEKVTTVGGYLGEKRTGQDLRRKWCDMKHRAKTKVAKITLEAEQNGGTSITHLTPLDERVLSLMTMINEPSQTITRQVIQTQPPALRVFSFQNDSNSQDSEGNFHEDDMSENEGNDSDLVSEIKSTPNEDKKRRLSEAFNNSTNVEKHLMMKKSRLLSDEEQLSEMCASQRQLNIELNSMKEILKKCQVSIEKLALLKKAELRLKCAKHGVEFEDLFD